GMTCWRHLRDWHKAGVFHELHRVLLDRLNAEEKLDWSRAVVDSASVRAIFGGRRPGRALWTAGKQARNTTALPTLRARHSRHRSPERIATTCRSCCRWSMPFLQSEAKSAIRDLDRAGCKPTAVTTL